MSFQYWNWLLTEIYNIQWLRTCITEVNKYVSRMMRYGYVAVMRDMRMGGHYLFIVCTSTTFLISRPGCRYLADYRMSMEQSCGWLRGCSKSCEVNDASYQNDLLVCQVAGIMLITNFRRIYPSNFLYSRSSRIPKGKLILVYRKGNQVK